MSVGWPVRTRASFPHAHSYFWNKGPAKQCPTSRPSTLSVTASTQEHAWQRSEALFLTHPDILEKHGALLWLPDILDLIHCHVILRAEGGDSESELENNVFSLGCASWFYKYFWTCSLCQALKPHKNLEEWMRLLLSSYIGNQGTKKLTCPRSYTGRRSRDRSLQAADCCSPRVTRLVFFLFHYSLRPTCGKAFSMAHSLLIYSLFAWTFSD